MHWTNRFDSRERALADEILQQVRALAPYDERADHVIIDSALPDLGVASLGALTLQYHLDAVHDVVLSVEFLLSAQTVAEIVRKVAERCAENERAVATCAEAE